MLKFKHWLISLFLLWLILPVSVFAHETKNNTIDFYWAIGCQYCEAEQNFLDNLLKEQPELKVNSFEITRNIENGKTLSDRLDERNIKLSNVPITFIGEQIIVGFDKDKTPDIVKDALKNPDEEKVVYGSTCEVDGAAQCKVDQNTVKVPFWGEIYPKTISLPLLTIALGLADGFNPCAMWALVALLGILIGLKSRKKLVIVGGSFLLFSYLIYVVFMAAWLNVFLLIGYIRIVQIVVGVLAIVFGLNYLRDFLRTDPTTCKIVAPRKKNDIIEKFKKIAANDFLPFAIVGVALLAVAVNTIEALCSVGIPAVYTKTLADAGLSKLQYAGYIGAYNIFYMLDDLIIFGIAVFSKDIIHLSPKYRYWGILVGALVLLALGSVFIIRPELLNL